MELEKKIKIINYIKLFALIMACVYMAVWFIEWLCPPPIFNKINTVLGFMPSIFNKIFRSYADFGYRKIPMGYVHTAIVNVIILYICKILNKNIEKQRIREIETEDKRRLIQQSKLKKEKEQQKIKQIKFRELFFGLLELNLEYFDSFGKDSKELDKLKVEYCKIISEKLKLKHQNINFVAKDKLFFIFSDYVSLKLVTKDILKILDIIIKTSKDKKIKTNILFSYWIDDKATSKSSIFRALSQINKFENFNKIIIPNEVYLKIVNEENQPWCQVNPIGTYTLFKIYDSEDTQVDLYELTNIN